MIQIVCLVALIVSVSAAPGIPSYGLDDYHLASAYLKAAPVIPAYLKAAPVIQAPAPIVAHAPVLEHAPVYQPAPVYAPAPAIVKAAPVVAAPVVKAIAPATSYATVTQVHVTHPQVIKVAQPVYKTVVAPHPPIIAAAPVLKSYAPLPAPLPISYGHDYGYSYGHGYH